MHSNTSAWSKREKAEDEKSGREHDEPCSLCLGAMVHAFIESDSGGEDCGQATLCSSCLKGRTTDGNGRNEFQLLKILQGLLTRVNKIETRVLAETVRCVKNYNGQHHHLKHIVVRMLKRAGFDAAICKTSWMHSEGFLSGEYEYIDVVFEGEPHHHRLIVEVELRSEFEIVRPTSKHLRMLQSLPSIFVGRSERLKEIVDVMLSSAMESFHKRGLHIPPWRRPQYVRAKWFSHYKRIISSEDDCNI